MDEQQHRQILDNSTKLVTFLVSSSYSSPVRTRTVINVIYISGIIFMISVFLILLWVNLYSRRCWRWHDTSLTNRFNRQWLIQRSLARNTDISLSKNQRQHKSSNDDEFSF